MSVSETPLQTSASTTLRSHFAHCSWPQTDDRRAHKPKRRSSRFLAVAGSFAPCSDCFDLGTLLGRPSATPAVGPKAMDGGFPSQRGRGFDGPMGRGGAGRGGFRGTANLLYFGLSCASSCLLNAVTSARDGLRQLYPLNAHQSGDRSAMSFPVRLWARRSLTCMQHGEFGACTCRYPLPAVAAQGTSQTRRRGSA